MKRAIAGAVAATGAVIGAYAAVVYLDRGYFTREAVVMLGVLIVAGFAFVLGIVWCWRKPRRRRAEITLIPRRYR